jgi:hypothetical protein
MSEFSLFILLNSGLAIFFISWVELIKTDFPIRSKKALFKCLLFSSFLIMIGIVGIFILAILVASYQAVESFIKLPWGEK